MRPKWPRFHARPHPHPHPHPDTKNTASWAAFFMFGYLSNPHPIPSTKKAAEMASFFVLGLYFLPSPLTLIQTRKIRPVGPHFLCLGTCPIPIPFRARKMRPKWPRFSCLAFASLLRLPSHPNKNVAKPAAFFVLFLSCLSHISPMSRVLFVYIIVTGI